MSTGVASRHTSTTTMTSNSASGAKRIDLLMRSLSVAIGRSDGAAGAKAVLATSLKYAKDRKAFGKSIAEFGMIQHKLADMAIRIFAAESTSYRTLGLIQSQRVDWSWSQPDAAQVMLKAVEEFARRYAELEAKR